MRLKVIDQIQVTAVQADVLKPGQEIAVSAALGGELLKRLPRSFEELNDAASDEDVAMTAEKSSPAPDNKAEPAAPANKATAPRKNKAKSAT